MRRLRALHGGLQRFVRELNARGVAILWATPGGDDVALARDAIVLEEGRIVFAGPAGELQAPDDTIAREDLSGRAPSSSPMHAPRLRMEKVSFASTESGPLTEIPQVVFAAHDLCEPVRSPRLA